MTFEKLMPRGNAVVDDPTAQWRRPGIDPHAAEEADRYRAFALREPVLPVLPPARTDELNALETKAIEHLTEYQDVLDEMHQSGYFADVDVELERRIRKGAPAATLDELVREKIDLADREQAALDATRAAIQALKAYIRSHRADLRALAQAQVDEWEAAYLTESRRLANALHGYRQAVESLGALVQGMGDAAGSRVPVVAAIPLKPVNGTLPTADAQQVVARVRQLLTDMDRRHGTGLPDPRDVADDEATPERKTRRKTPKDTP